MRLIVTPRAIMAAVVGAWWALAAASPVLAQATTTATLRTVRLCVFDPSGTVGDAWRAATDHRLEMQQHGVDLVTQPYTNERVAVEDYRTGRCDALMATALRTRSFHGMAAALDSMGAATVVKGDRVDVDASFEVVRRFVEVLSEPKAAEMMVSGEHEVAGVLPMGAAYVFSRDRGLNVLAGLQGRKVATLDHDQAQAELVRRLGGTPVSADTLNFGAMFNNGHVEVLIAPTIAYKPLELQRGLGTQGGVSRFPLTIYTYQLVLRRSAVPAGFAQRSRSYMAQNFDVAIASLRLADRGVPAAYWVDVPAASVQPAISLLREVRQTMAQQGVYDPKGLRLAKRLRCEQAPGAAECASSDPW